MKRRIIFTALLLTVSGIPSAYGQDSGAVVEEKLYNFDDMLIDGEFRDPQGMYERARAEAKFESVLKNERSFMPRLDENAQESTMRP